MLSICGVWLVALGFYFSVLRPPLLPEDLRFMGTTLATLRVAVPGLEGLTVATMSAANFALHSDYRWLLLMPVLIWLAGLSAYVLSSPTEQA